MSVGEREIVKGMYPKSKRWAGRVEQMPDGQVHMIYLRYTTMLDEQMKDIPDNINSTEEEEF